VNWNFQEILTKDPSSAWGCDTSGNIPPCGVALRRTCRCTEFHRVKTQICVTRPQCVKYTEFTLKHSNFYSHPRKPVRDPTWGPWRFTRLSSLPCDGAKWTTFYFKAKARGRCGNQCALTGPNFYPNMTCRSLRR